MSDPTDNATKAIERHFGSWRTPYYFAAQLHRHPRTVQALFDRAGLRYRRFGKSRFYDEADVAALFSTGHAPQPPRPRVRRRRLTQPAS